ncbi:hypothetical protein B0H94_106158 [Salsuginibacillus halophilus]|uniref:Uncharacterized protein n=1 Tax=Salsuginibacillus halophilus TaxID=517424 RepID=A0A2P8HI62_9BACI|nr:hypothetical protein [Salsuginibacillus halophilus]PSL45903.1 hypothetical protein B0H94_106158 [Salsuginibacillus halophilus]
MIIIGDVQIPAQKFTDETEARNACKHDQMVVKDGDDILWVVDQDNFPKIEAYGYTALEDQHD